MRCGISTCFDFECVAPHFYDPQFEDAIEWAADTLRSKPKIRELEALGKPKIFRLTGEVGVPLHIEYVELNLILPLEKMKKRLNADFYNFKSYKDSSERSRYLGQRVHADYAVQFYKLKENKR